MAESSSTTLSYKGSPLNSLRECDDQIASFKLLIKANKRDSSNIEKELKMLKENVLQLREKRDLLHQEVLTVTKSIAMSDTLCFSLKNKLSYFSRNVILDNVKKLEVQLRMNNYRPREEELVLREITRLRNSLPLLEEYREKMNENRYLHNERQKLIRQRNAKFEKLQQLGEKEKLLRDKLQSVIDTIHDNDKGLEELINKKEVLLQIAKEKLKRRQQRRTSKRHISISEPPTKELTATSSPQPSVIPRTIVLPAKNIYIPQISACKLLQSYMKALIQGQHTDTASPPSEASAAATPSSDPQNSVPVSSGGQFYSKPQQDEICSSFTRSKRKSRKGRGANKKDLSHPPEVVSHCLDLGITIPVTVEQVPATIKLVQDKLNYYELCNEQLYFDSLMQIMDAHENSNQVICDSESDIKTIEDRSKLDSISSSDVLSSNTVSSSKSLDNSSVVRLVSNSGGPIQTFSRHDSSDDIESGVGDDDITVASDDDVTVSSIPDIIIEEFEAPTVSCCDPTISTDSTTSSGCSSTCAPSAVASADCDNTSNVPVAPSVGCIQPTMSKGKTPLESDVGCAQPHLLEDDSESNTSTPDSANGNCSSVITSSIGHYFNRTDSSSTILSGDTSVAASATLDNNSFNDCTSQAESVTNPIEGISIGVNTSSSNALSSTYVISSSPTSLLTFKSIPSSNFIASNSSPHATDLPVSVIKSVASPNVSISSVDVSTSTCSSSAPSIVASSFICPTNASTSSTIVALSSQTTMASSPIPPPSPTVGVCGDGFCAVPPSYFLPPVTSVASNCQISYAAATKSHAQCKRS